MDFKPMDALLERIIEAGIPGVDLKIRRGGETVYRKCLGWRDREAGLPMIGDEVGWIFSATKLITCVAALQLYERGLFQLSDPISAYLPCFKDMTVAHRQINGWVDVRPAREEITIRHLFTMTSGLDYDLHTPEIEAAIRETGGRAPTLKMAEIIAKRPLLFEPGRHYAYGLSHDILAALVEVLSGQRFADYVREHIFEPCGMADSGFHPTAAQLGRMARLYTYDPGQGRAIPTDNHNEYVFGTEYDSGGAGMLCTVDDYAAFIDTLCAWGVTPGGERIVSRGAIELMRRNHLSPAQLDDYHVDNYPGYGYGLGVRTLMDPAPSGALGPAGEYGWGGAAGAHVVIQPELGLTLYFSMHMLNCMEFWIHQALRNTMYACMEY